jgi:hypothetical protein
MAHSGAISMTVRRRKTREKNYKGKWLFPKKTRSIILRRVL